MRSSISFSMVLRGAIYAGAGALVVAVSLGACSDDGGATEPAASPNASAAPRESASDAMAPITARPDLCSGVATGGERVGELEISSEVPAALGGDIARGTYDLVELTTYTGKPPAEAEDGKEAAPSTRVTGRAMQATLVVGAFEMQLVTARAETDDGPLGAVEASGALYRIEGSSLIQTAVCPSTGTPAPVPFSAAGNGVALFLDATHRAVFARREP